MKRYTCVLVYGWYTKVIKKIWNQKLQYTKRYTKILVYERYTRQKMPYKVVYRPFFLPWWYEWYQKSISSLANRLSIIAGARNVTLHLQWPLQHPSMALSVLINKIKLKYKKDPSLQKTLPAPAKMISNTHQHPLHDCLCLKYYEWFVWDSITAKKKFGIRRRKAFGIHIPNFFLLCIGCEN